MLPIIELQKMTNSDWKARCQLSKQYRSKQPSCFIMKHKDVGTHWNRIQKPYEEHSIKKENLSRIFADRIFSMSMSKKRLLSIVVSAVILLSFACTAMAAEKSERYVGDSTVNGSIYQTYYQVDAQTRTGVKKISVSGVLYEKGTIGTWQKVSSCSNSSTTSTCMVSSSFNTKPGKSYRLEYSATFSYSDGRSETITGSTSR